MVNFMSNLSYNPLIILTGSHVVWIEKLISSGCGDRYPAEIPWIISINSPNVQYCLHWNRTLVQVLDFRRKYPIHYVWKEKYIIFYIITSKIRFAFFVFKNEFDNKHTYIKLLVRFLESCSFLPHFLIKHVRWLKVSVLINRMENCVYLQLS